MYESTKTNNKHNEFVFKFEHDWNDLSPRLMQTEGALPLKMSNSTLLHERCEDGGGLSKVTILPSEIVVGGNAVAIGNHRDVIQ